MTLTLHGTQAQYIEQVEKLLHRLKEMTPLEFLMMANEVKKPLTTPLG